MVNDEPSTNITAEKTTGRAEGKETENQGAKSLEIHHTVNNLHQVVFNQGYQIYNPQFQQPVQQMLPQFQ